MALASGLAGYIGWKKETTYGTAVTASEFLPWTTQSLVDGIDKQEVISRGIISGRRVQTVDQTDAGLIMISGDTGFEIHSEGAEELFELIFGTDTTTGAGPYTHTYSMSDLPSATVSIGIPELDGSQTIRDFAFAGCKVASWELAVTAGEYARLGITWVAQTVAVGSALTPSFPADASKFRFDQADFQHDTTSMCVDAVTIRGDNGLETDKRCLNQTYVDEPRQIRHRTYSLEATARFQNTTLYNDYIAKNTESLDLVFTESGDDTLTITCDGKLQAGSAPRMSDSGAVTQTLSANLFGSSSDDDAAIQAVLVNDVA